MSRSIKKAILALLTFLFIICTVTVPAFAETAEENGTAALSEDPSEQEDPSIPEEQPIEEELPETSAEEEQPPQEEPTEQEADEDIESGYEAVEPQTGVITIRIISSQLQPSNALVFGIYADEACTQEEERLLFDGSDTCTGEKEYELNETLFIKQLETNEYYRQLDRVFSVTVSEKVTVIEIELPPVEQVIPLFSDSVDIDPYYDALSWIKSTQLFSGYADGTFGVGSFAVRGDVFQMLYKYAGEPTVTMRNCALTDVENTDAHAVEASWAYETGMLHGYAKQYRKDEKITRAEAIYALWTLNGSPAQAYKGVYNDVSADLYYASAVAWAFDNGLTIGSTNDRFFPDDALKREDFAALLFQFNTSGLTVAAKTVYVETPVLRKISNAKSGITLSWNEVPGAYKYRVFRKSANASGWKKLADVKDAVSYTDRTNLVDGRSYRYTVRCIARDGSFSSPYDTIGLTMVRLPYVKLKLKEESKGIKMTWTAFSKIDGYKLYRREEGADSWTEIKTIKNPKTTKYTDTSAKFGTTYSYRIRAYKAVNGKRFLGYGDKGKSIRRWLAAPTLISAKNSATGITVKWKAVPGSKQYRIYRKAENSSKWKSIGVTGKTSYKDKDPIRAGIKYYYTVRCLNEDGLLASDYDTKGRSAKRMLAAPTLTSAKNDGSGGIKIQWNAVAGAEKYRVYRRASAKEDWKKVANTNSASFTDQTSLAPGKKYYYTVRCISSDGKTKQSDIDSKGIAVTKQLATPRMISATQNGSTVTIRWNGVSGAHRYRLLRREDNGTWTVIGELKKTSYKDTKNLKDNRTYFYTVQCVSADGKTKESTYDKTGVGLIYNLENLPVLPIDFAQEGNAVFIGDSWTCGIGTHGRVNRFSTRLSNMMGLNEFNFGVKGSGFIIQRKPFAFQLDSAIETMTDIEKEWTRYVFIVAGVNDVRHYGNEAYHESYNSAVYNACLVALETFPNATIVLAQGTIIESGGLRSYHDMIADCDMFLDANLNSDRVIRVPDIGLLLAKANAAYWANDALHPSNAGHSLLASYLYAYICNGSMGVDQYCGIMTPGENITAQTDCRIWKSNDTMYIEKGIYTISEKLIYGTSIEIGSISTYLSPNETMTVGANSGTRTVGTITIDPDGILTFTADEDFQGEITVPELIWPCLGEDRTKKEY
ncbi:MAG: S-layer homology domain-containing protein [Clostridiales bacterium]|nr:S-layer homology domain-containing protein [Clostridiales bacterium]